MQKERMSQRLKKELAMLKDNPPDGISCWLKGEQLDALSAQIVGSKDSPYDGGLFSLEICLPKSYPMDPPQVKFITPIYHPNIDNAGRICLDTLKMPPEGKWTPALNLSSLLTTIRLLMSVPNPDDPLMADIAKEFVSNKAEFERKARELTQKHAVPKEESSSSEDSDEDEDEDKNSNRKRTSDAGHSPLQRNAKKLKP